MFNTLYNFFASAASYAKSEAGGGRYHRLIVRAGIVCGFALSGIGTCAVFWNGFPKGESPKVLLAPIIFFIMGCVSGASVALTFAPRAFLTGQAGKRWMELIGTESVTIGRIVCAIITLIFLSFLAMLGWGAWSDLQRGLL